MPVCKAFSRILLLNRNVYIIEFCKAKLGSVRETCFAALGIKNALYAEIAFQYQKGVENAVDMAPFIAVGRINARADQTVADVIARFQRRFYVASVVRINIHRIVRVLFLRGGNQPVTS